jgi:DNA-binding MarR family transcriptional regulator
MQGSDMPEPTQAPVVDAGGRRRIDGAEARLLLDSILPYQINQLSYRMNRNLDLELRQQGLSISIWRIMSVLDFNAAITVNDLARYAMIEQSTLSRILKRMEVEGLLVNRKSERDGRVRAVDLTPLGRARYDTVRTVTMKHVGHVISDLSQDERVQLADFVARMRKSLDAAGARGEPGR